MTGDLPAIIARRICPSPDRSCFEGHCKNCNRYAFTSIEKVSRLAEDAGLVTSYNSGLVQRFLRADIRVEGSPLGFGR